ncbi:hypothetical protein [Phenylobacterium sp. 58.2.17]|uniref:hypothetical protein n=1 Tax=Phenylobacterium sp. 58.2.17 TaxID=2969306 RepID=UPI0022653E44|nr:hypothetical protein [Phenylobacterium sp. 58.2.17]MCX7585668.1 hypothetical protein [Phenylobacterium sp. 58.2.17]
MSLAPSIIEQASAYRYYVDKAAAISPAFVDGQMVAEGLKVAAAYEPKQFLKGAIAYGAIVALQDPTFVAGVRQYAGTAAQRQQIAYEIMKDPAYVVGLPGSSSGAGAVIAALGEDGNKFYQAGKTVKQAAYDVQKQSWSKADVVGRDARLSQAKLLGSTPAAGDLTQTSRLQQAVAGAQPLGVTATSAAPPFTPAVIRSLAVAALAVLGQASEPNVATLNAIMVEPNVASCANMAKLNLYQCLAVSKPHYEDVFCMGQHAMMDTARCVIKASGQPEPFEPRFVPTVRENASYKPTPAKKPATKKPAKKG